MFIAGFGQAVLFSFIAGSPFVVVTLHRVPPTIFGILFALHAIAVIGMSQFNAPMMRHFGARRMIGGGTGALAATSLLLAALVFGGMTALWPLILLTITLFLCLGVILAPAFLTAMEPFGATAGAAAALGVGMEFTISSVTTAMMGADGGWHGAANGRLHHARRMLFVLHMGRLRENHASGAAPLLKPAWPMRSPSNVSRAKIKRGNTVSDSQHDENLQRVREIAYSLWEKEGSPEGRHDEFWLRAEAIVQEDNLLPYMPAEPAAPHEDVDLDSEQSFPASDPPSFSPSKAGGTEKAA